MQRLLYLFIVSIVVAGCKQDVAYQSYVELYNLRKQGKEEVKIVRKSIDYIIDNIEGKHSLIDGGLSVAFETTLIALIAALIVQLLMTFLISREELFLDECADYCHQSVISRIRSIETVAVPAAAGEREGI